MKIAITADVHLKKQSETPERYSALESILQQIQQRGIENFIIAGDLFDRDFSNYIDFDNLCKQFPSVTITVIPGNHDYQIEERFFTSSNIRIIKDIHIETAEDATIVFLPYDPVKSMDEALSEYYHREKLPERWILIGHGDYITGIREPNPYESGVYMPLTTKVLHRYNPLRVFLGHIHKPSNIGKVLYPGSPCGLDITETGRRRFLIYDTKSDSVEEVFVPVEKIYFDESVVLFPFEEDTYLQAKIKEMIDKWGLERDELSKVTVRLSLKGYVTNLRETEKKIKDIISSYEIKLYDNGIDFSSIKVLEELEDDRFYILQKVYEKIEGLDFSRFRTSKEKVLEKSMELIFG